MMKQKEYYKHQDSDICGKNTVILAKTSDINLALFVLVASLQLHS